MTRRVLLHIGTPKTGTSYVQDVLFRNRTRLASHGVHYPADRFDAHFLAAIDLLDLPWGGLLEEARGHWQRLVEETTRRQGTVIVSHEVFARASAEQAARALAALGHGRPDVEVHLVLTARDLARQIPAEWQENVKHRERFTYRRFLEIIRDPERATRVGAWFWGVQELPAVLERWGSSLPPERVHLVTVPHPGAGRDLLWQRISAVLGLDAVPGLDLESGRANPSLGVPETELLRRINARMRREKLESGDYRWVIRELLAHRTLSRRSDSPRTTVPPELRPWVEELSADWIDALRKSGYDVRGDLEELRPSYPDTPYVDPDEPPLDQLVDASLDAVEALAMESVRARRREALLEEEVHRLLDRRPGRRVVRALERGRPGRLLLRCGRSAVRRLRSRGV